MNAAARRGLVGLCHNPLNKEWEDMCRGEYAPDAVSDKPKINGVVAALEEPQTGERCGRRQGTKADTYS